MNNIISEKASGILAVEDPDGQQSWALIVDAQISYENDIEYGPDGAQYTVTATLPPGETMHTASGKPDEENVLLYTTLLVGVLREERNRLADLQRRFAAMAGQEREAREELAAAQRGHAAALREAWSDGAQWGYSAHRSGWPIQKVLDLNPHPPVEDDDEGCHVCGGPDH